MILYKYMSFSSAIAMLEKTSLGFSALEDLNDPFEGTNFGFSKQGEITPENAVRVFKEYFSRKYAVSSLTRNPLNALMWSHYGDSHRGVVVGIDANEAGLMSNDEFIIPAHLGEIIYVSTKNRNLNGIPSQEHLDELRSEIEFKNDIANYLKQAFLYKSLEWGYEEEIRVIKSLSQFSFTYHGNYDEKLCLDNTWFKVRNSHLGQPLFCYKLPKNSIKEVYLGSNIYRNGSRLNEGKNKQQFKEQLDFIKEQKYKVFQCKPDLSSWDIITEEK